VKHLRRDGLLDWYILLLVHNLIIQYRLEKRYGRLVS